LIQNRINIEDRKKHWETVFKTKQPNEVSWTQEYPKTSLDLIHNFHLTKTASIIDVGAGDSKLVDILLNEGFENITVLDISEESLLRVKKRLGSNANKVKWIVCDIINFHPDTKYDLWHDRAAFHFLNSSDEINTYLSTAKDAVKGFMIIGTFSDKGPNKCSGLDVNRYSEAKLQDQLSDGFKKIKCFTEDHITPSGVKQNFLFCSFKRTNKNN
jgi:hypothetical protein